MSIRLNVIAGCAMTFFILTAGAAEARSHDRTTSSMVLHQQEAGAMLRGEGLRWISSGHCTRRTNPHCTSFEGIRPATMNGVLHLKDVSGCGLVISGGTETGHAGGRYSHGGGYKLDILPNRCLNRFIKAQFQRVPVRGDGSQQYRAPNHTTFAREPSHWDVTFA